jgi:hypothetical protein
MSMKLRSMVLSGCVACLLGVPLVVGAQGQDAGAKAQGQAPQVGPEASAVQSAEGGRLQISGAMRKDVIKCTAGQEVEIAGTSHDLQLTGDCGEVVISGNAHKIKIDGAEAITVMGVGNKVTWKRGEPKQETRGTNNTLTREK